MSVDILTKIRQQLAKSIEWDKNGSTALHRYGQKRSKNGGHKLIKQLIGNW